MLFKKCFSVLLTSFLLASHLGLAFNVHYCSDEVASISLNLVPKLSSKIDECCGVIESNSLCCHDKIISSKVKSDHILVPTFIFECCIFSHVSNSNSVVFNLESKIKDQVNLDSYFDAHAPPLYLLHSQYTFYC